MCDVCFDPCHFAPCPTCRFSMCRPCARRGVDAQQGTLACPCCARAWDWDETTTRLGRVYVATTLRVKRRAWLLDASRATLFRLAPAAEHERTRRLLEARVKQLMRSMAAQPGPLIATPVHLVLALRRANRALLVHTTGTQRAGTPTQACARCGNVVSASDASTLAFCGRCHSHTCSQCGQSVDDEEHQCDPLELASLRVVATECRCCPTCRAPSTRIEGCPVMWCAACHGFWNWDTGRRIEARVPPHNPDHRAWAAVSRELDDVPCGGFPDAFAFARAFQRDFRWRLARQPPPITDAVIATLRRFADPRPQLNALHVAQRLRHSYPTTIDPRAADDLCLRYMLGDLSEPAFATRLERLDRTQRLHSDVGLVLEGFVFAGADILQRYCGEDACAGDDFLHSLRTLRSVADDALGRLQWVHGRVVPRLDDSWHWTRPRRVNP